MEKRENDKQKPTEANKRERFWPIVSAKLPTGQLVETLHRPDVPETVFVAGSHGETVELGKVPAPGGGWYVPYSPRNNLLTHRVVLLPSAVDEYQAEPILLALVRGFIRRYVDLSPDFEEVAAHYVLFTWVYDDFSELPYLRVQGDYGSGKSRFLQTVGSLCYKPIFASGASTVSPLFRVLDSVGGTLVIDEGDFRFSDEKSEIIKILNNGNAQGFPVLRSEQRPTGEYDPRAFTVFGPKLVATRHAFDDKALESRCITEVLGRRRLRRDVPLNLPASFHAEALSLRNKLLLYRFRHAGEARDLDGLFDGSLEPRVAQVFGPLLATVEDGDARGRLVQVASRMSAALRQDRLHDAPRKLVEVLLELAGAGSTSVAVSELTAAFNERLGVDVSPRWIGALLRRDLRLAPRRGAGGAYLLPSDELQKLPEVARRFGVVRVSEQVNVGREEGEGEARRNQGEKPSPRSPDTPENVHLFTN